MAKDFKNFTAQPKSPNAGGMLPPVNIAFEWVDCKNVEKDPKTGEVLANPYQICILKAGGAEYEWRMNKMLVSHLTGDAQFVTVHEYTDSCFEKYFKYIETDEKMIILAGSAISADTKFDEEKHIRLANGKAYPFRKVNKIKAVACNADGSNL
jgi:hypothetical protein